MFAHTLYLNRELEKEGGGGGGVVTPWSNILLLSMNRDVWIVNCEYTYIEEIKSLLMNSLFFYLFFWLLFFQPARTSAKKKAWN